MKIFALEFFLFEQQYNFTKKWNFKKKNEIL